MIETPTQAQEQAQAQAQEQAQHHEKYQIDGISSLMANNMTEFKKKKKNTTVHRTFRSFRMFVYRTV